MRVVHDGCYASKSQRSSESQPVQNGTVKFAVAAFSLVIQGLSLYLDCLKFEKQH